MLGASRPEEICGRRALDFAHPDYHGVVRKRMQLTDSRGLRFGLSEQKFLRLDGLPIDVEVCSGPIDYGGRRGSHLILRDISDRKRIENALRSSEERFRLAARAVADLIYEWDAARDSTQWFGDISAALGYSRSEAPSTRSSFRSLLHPEDVERVRAAAEKVVPAGKPFRQEYRIRAADGEYRFWRVHAVCVKDQDGRASKYVGACTDITDQKRAELALRESEAALRRSREELRALTASLIGKQEEVRREISRDLHDDLNQKLAMVALELETLEHSLPANLPEPREQARALRARVLHVAEDVRRIAYRLHPSILEHLGLAVALQSLCNEFARREGIPVRFQQRHAPSLISQEAAVCLYRVAQEALHNIARHSEAPRADVTLTGTTNGGLLLTISDRGKGFSPTANRHRRGLGIVSMEERVRLLNGHFSIQASPGTGTRLRVRLPVRSGAPGA
jgi:PAS domain S-box-containing protein